MAVGVCSKERLKKKNFNWNAKQNKDVKLLLIKIVNFIFIKWI
jgi:hypothetical protein